MYQRYASLCEEAGTLGVPFETVTLPVAKAHLLELGRELSAAVKLAKDAAA
jgi:hypothetical protein